VSFIIKESSLGCPESIDLELNPINRTLNWTDRGDPPRGRTVNRAPMDPEADKRKGPQGIVVDGDDDQQFQ